MPLALLRVVPSGWARRVVNIGKWLAIAALVLLLVPFLARQVQQALYPQLEFFGPPQARPLPPRPSSVDYGEERDESALLEHEETPAAKSPRLVSPTQDVNLMYQPNARIQTGPC
jgi:hypothetical protein